MHDRCVGVRIGWTDLPIDVRGAVEVIVGGAVVEAVSQVGGFSPGTADRVRTADGRQDLIAVLTGIAGFFADAAWQPPPKGLPTVRTFQRANADTVLSWLRPRYPPSPTDANQDTDRVTLKIESGPAAILRPAPS